MVPDAWWRSPPAGRTDRVAARTARSGRPIAGARSSRAPAPGTAAVTLPDNRVVEYPLRPAPSVRARAVRSVTTRSTVQDLLALFVTSGAPNDLPGAYHWKAKEGEVDPNGRLKGWLAGRGQGRTASASTVAGRGDDPQALVEGPVERSRDGTTEALPFRRAARASAYGMRAACSRASLGGGDRRRSDARSTRAKGHDLNGLCSMRAVSPAILRSSWISRDRTARPRAARHRDAREPAARFPLPASTAAPKSPRCDQALCRDRHPRGYRDAIAGDDSSPRWRAAGV